MARVLVAGLINIETTLRVERFPLDYFPVTYLRFAFGGQVGTHDPERALDDGIVAAHWLTLDEIRARQAQHRSPLVLRCIDDWRADRRYPLALLNYCPCP